MIRYRRRSDDEIPVQTRYNLPLEIFYTIAPVVMVIVFFAHTVRTQNIVLEDDTAPENIIEVTGQQWSWTFNYGLGEPDNSADDDRYDDDFAYDSYVHDGGTGSYIPELWLPVDETTRFNLHSPDVIHDFGCPGVPHEDGRRPGPGEPLRHQADPDRRLDGQVLRALRGLPLADALRGARGQP